jgi:hypothetical protein
MSDRRRVHDVDDLGRAQTLMSLAPYGLRHGDAGILASARRFLKEMLARHDRTFRDTLVNTIAAEAKAGGDFHRHRAAAALDCARVLPSLPWLDLGPVEPRGRA